MSESFKQDLQRRLHDVEFRQEFGATRAKTDVALTLSRARRATQMTQEQLAGLLGTRQSYIAKLEAGDANPTLGMIGKILAMLGLRLTTGYTDLVTKRGPSKSILEQAGEVIEYTWRADQMPRTSIESSHSADMSPVS